MPTFTAFKNKPMKRFCYILFLAIVGSACKEVYEAPPQALVQASFLNSESNKAISSTISIWGIGRENLWVKDTLLSTVIFPLSSNDTTNYLISFDSKVDTVRLIHETFKKYDSMETGFYFDFKIKSIDYTNNRIDYILIIDSLVTKDWHENIKFYLRPLPAGNN